MRLNVDYLQQRHKYWLERISATGIWYKELFRPVKFEIRSPSRSYQGLFQRKVNSVGGRKRMTDTIIIYENLYDMSVREIDDTLVHEMIHQYIYQSNLHDTSTHGRMFKDLMRLINETFPEDLKITISSETRKLKGPGQSLHKLILVQMTNNDCYCCKISSKEIDKFMRLLDNNRARNNIRDYILCESNDRYFDSFPACRKYLHGEPMSLGDLKALCRECNIRRI